MRFSEYRQYDAIGLAALVAAGEVSASELLRVALDSAQQQAKLNTIVMPMFDIARERAKQPLSGAFAGVPFLVKDLMQEYAGVPTAMGNKALKEARFTPDAHSEMTRRWLDAGLVVAGRTNTPEFGRKAITEPDAWGATRNPWNTDHIPGGSSGGSAAAVAAGIVPAAGANDGGGSIRIPAACCGLFGLKPGRGRTPLGPAAGEDMHGAVINHVLTRSVRDSAALLDVECGSETASLFHVAPPATSYQEAIKQAPDTLCIAFSSQSPIGTPVDDEARQALEDAAQLLQSLGHRVEMAEPPIDGLQLAQDFLVMWMVDTALHVDRVKALTGCGNEGFELDTLALAMMGRRYSATDYAEAYHRWLQYSQQMNAFLEQYDLFMTPALAAPPAKIGEIATPKWQQYAMRMLMKSGSFGLVAKSGMIEKMAVENLRWVPFTQLANLTGVPAMSVPLHWCQNGLPLGVQFVGPHGGETLLLQLAAQLEKAQPWFDQVPE